MEEDRLQAYINLIGQLLSCDNQEDFSQTLNDNQNLLDGNLLETLEQIIPLLREQAREEEAQRCENLGQGLKQILAYQAFLLEVLQAEDESDGNTEVVYSILQRNLDKLNPYFAQLLGEWARNYFAQNSPEDSNKVAMVIGNLSIDIINFPYGNPANNLEIAITGFEAVLEVRTAESSPTNRARTLNNLGTAQKTQAQLGIDPNQNLEGAIAAYEEAVRILRQPRLERDLSQTLNNLGIAQQTQAQLGIDPNQNLERAIAAYRESLNFLKPDILPSDCLTTARNLGNLAFVQGWWEIAVEGYSQGIEAVEQTRLWATTEKSKQEIQEQAKEIYDKVVQSLIELKQYSQALEYVERSKARNLVELLATKDLYPKGEIPETIRKELDRLRKEVRIEQRRLGAKNNIPQSDAKGIESGIISSRLPQLQQELDRLIKEHIQEVDKTFSLSQKVTPISLEEIQSLIPNDSTAIVQWYFSDNDIYAFIITHNPEQPVLIHIAPNLENLQNLAGEYLQDYFNSEDPDKTKWKTELQNRMQRMREILGIDTIKGKIAELVPNCQRLLLVPYRYLHIFPLHALFDIEDFPQGISYTPSCQIQKTIKPPEDNNLEPFLAIQNPTEDLDYTDLEVDTIRENHFPDDQNTVLLGSECTKDSILDNDLALRQCLHFSCHGYFNLEQPMESALLLAECEINSPPPELDPLRYLPLRNGSVIDLERCLTVKDIFELDLRQCRMAVLSACETGFSDIGSSTDEYVGLPSAFLFAGTRTVVSSLWAVSDLATALLMVRFYELLKDQDNPLTYLCPRVSLHQAQIWLRDSKAGELTDWVERMPPSGSRLHLLAYLSTIDGEAQPFSQPQFWAAFCAIGF